MPPSTAKIRDAVYAPSTLIASVSPSPLRQVQAVHPPKQRSLHIPGLPRFHPANFSSLQDGGVSSLAAVAHSFSATSYTSRQPPPRQSLDAQKQLYLHQQHFGRMSRTASATGTISPRCASPHLRPAGSPGPVTPMELERGDEYFTVAATRGVLSETGKNDIYDHHMRKERKQQKKITDSCRA